MAINTFDNTLPRATNLGLLNDRRTIQGFVGRLDKVDSYRFTLSGRSRFSLALEGLPEAATIRLIDGGGRILANAKGRSRQINRSLEAGTYYLSVQRRQGGGRYRLAATTRLLREPGASLGSAMNLGMLATTRSYSDAVGIGDSLDYYRFTLPEIGEFNATLSHSTRHIGMRLLRDANNNGLIDQGERLSSGYGNRYETTPISLTLPSGAYFLEVQTMYASEAHRYSLTLSITPKSGTAVVDPGSSSIAAYDLGTLVDRRVERELVGSIDPTDYYRFGLDQKRQFNATLTEVSQYVSMRLIHDANRNGLIDSNERVDFGYADRNQIQSISKELQAGTYFLAVQSSSASNTAYALTVAV